MFVAEGINLSTIVGKDAFDTTKFSINVMDESSSKLATKKDLEAARRAASPSSPMLTSSIAIAVRGHCLFPARSPLLRPLQSPMRYLLLHVVAATSVVDVSILDTILYEARHVKSSVGSFDL